MNLRHITDVHQQPVLDLETGEMLGHVSSWVINPASQKVVAFTLTKLRGWQGTRVVVPADIVEYAPEMIVVQSQNAVIVPDEVAGLAELLDKHLELIGFRAETESGKLLGVVSDVVFDTIASTIWQYYIQSLSIVGTMTGNLILSANRVLRIEKRRIVFPDDILVVTTVVPCEQTQTI